MNGESNPGSARLLTVRQAADLLNIPVSTLYGWVSQRPTAFVKAGRAVRSDIGDLERFIEVDRHQVTTS